MATLSQPTAGLNQPRLSSTTWVPYQTANMPSSAASEYESREPINGCNASAAMPDIAVANTMKRATDDSRAGASLTRCSRSARTPAFVGAAAAMARR